MATATGTTIKVSNNDTGSVHVGKAPIKVGDAITIKGEDKARVVTYLMGSEAKGYWACMRGSGPVPTGEIEITITPA